MMNIAFMLVAACLFVISTASPGWAEINGKVLLDNCKEAVRYMDDKNASSINFSLLKFCVGYISGVNDLRKTCVDSVSNFEPLLFCAHMFGFQRHAAA